MPDLKDINNIYMIIAFVIPGLIITYVRAQFVTGRIDKFSDAVLGYLVLTLIYYGLMVPAIFGIIGLPAGLLKTFLWWIFIIIGPATFGLLLGIMVQHEWIQWIATKLRLRIVHGTPTSWDWRFGNCPNARFIMVTLSDGSTVSGIFGVESFASTDPTERDLYIQEIMNVSDDGAWSYRGEKVGILITSKEIKHIQFNKEL